MITAKTKIEGDITRPIKDFIQATTAQRAKAKFLKKYNWLSFDTWYISNPKKVKNYYFKGD
jgi:hypothetical protein